MNKNSIITFTVLLFIVASVAFIGCSLPVNLGSDNTSQNYYYTVSEILDNQRRLVGRDIRISGVIIGDTITYDPASFTLSFDIAHVTADMAEVEQQGGLDAILEKAASDLDNPRLSVVYYGVKPDLLRHGAQAILSGHLDQDGVFYIDDNGLLLKCPTKYEQSNPAP